MDLTSRHEDLNVLCVISNCLDSALQGALLECEQLDTLYCTLLATCDILPRCVGVRADRTKYMVLCLTLAARLSIHIVSSCAVFLELSNIILLFQLVSILLMCSCSLYHCREELRIYLKYLIVSLTWLTVRDLEIPCAL